MVDVVLTQYQGAILGPIAKVLGWILEAIYNGLALVGIENIGICIILFTFIVNGLMVPMQVKQMKFSRMSARMNPELTAIQKKYKGKTDEKSVRKMQMEQQAVYEKYGVSPASGCLPLLITFPILFALYRVIYNIPAYVGPVKEIYDSIATGITESGNYVDIIASYIASTDQAKEALANDSARETVNVVMSKWPKLTEALKEKNYIIDVLSQFRPDTWNQLKADFPALSGTITDTVKEINRVNTFCGMNITANPSIKSITILIPVFAVITQIISAKISMAGNPNSDKEPENEMAASMKTMNTVMPFISGVMCFMFPIGIGIYWIAGSVFRIIQGLCVNLYMDRLDIDEEMKKNQEKAAKRLEKMGMTQEEMNKIARQRTADIEKKSSNNIKKAAASVNQKKEYVSKNKGNKNYKEGSIAAYANMMRRDDTSDKEEKK